MVAKVVHCKREPFDIYIGRPSKFGNPFSHLMRDDLIHCETSKEAVERYAEWILTQPELMDSLHELKGKTLGCWCKIKGDEPCHGDILLELANG